MPGPRGGRSASGSPRPPCSGGTEPAQVVARSAAVGPVGDYLAAEVLAGLPAQAREVLMEISVAERVTAGLVNALTGRVDGAAVLTDLQRRGAFIMRCPGIDDTYRLHTMFSRALYQELGRHDQTRTVQAHGRAADWYLAQGPAVEALRHLLAAGDWERAARVLDNHWADVVVGSRRLNLPEIVSFAPDRDLPRHLWFAMAAERLDAGDAVAMRHLVRLASADQASESGAEDVPPYLLSAFRLAAARLDGDVTGACSVASQALAAPVPAAEPYTSASTTLRPIALLALGTAKLQLGHVPAAGDHLQEALALARQRDMETVEISTASHLAAWHAALGHLHDAVDCAGEALELGNRFGLGQLADLGWARLALAEAYFHWNRLDDSGRCADAAVDNSCGDRLIQLWGTILQVRIRTATGRLEDAHRMVRAARREMVTSDLPAPVKRALSLVDGELRLACGDLAGARECATAWPGSGPLPGPAAVLEGSILLAEGRPGLAASVVAPFVSDDDRCPSLTFRASAGLITALAGQALGHRERMTRGPRHRPQGGRGGRPEALFHCGGPGGARPYRVSGADDVRVPTGRGGPDRATGSDGGRHHRASRAGPARRGARRFPGGTAHQPGADGAALLAGHPVPRRDRSAAAHLGEHREDPRQEHLPEARHRSTQGRHPTGPRAAHAVTGRAATRELSPVGGEAGSPPHKEHGD
jgi:LuxR family maltose regulon positive regulatory protein